MQQQPMQQQIPPQLKQAIDNTPFISCGSCGCGYFDNVFMVKTVNLASVGRINEYLPVQVPVFRCSDCGEILKINEHGETTKANDQDKTAEGGIIREIR